jgi:hypothetical protein
VGALAELAFHAGGEAHGGVAEPVAETVGRSHGLLPAFVAGVVEKIHLTFGFGPGRGVHP